MAIGQILRTQCYISQYIYKTSWLIHESRKMSLEMKITMILFIILKHYNLKSFCTHFLYCPGPSATELNFPAQFRPFCTVPARLQQSWTFLHCFVLYIALQFFNMYSPSLTKLTCTCMILNISTHKQKYQRQIISFSKIMF